LTASVGSTATNCRTRLPFTTEAMVAEMPKKQGGAPAMPGGGMGGMDY